MLKLLWYPPCISCRNAKNWLDNNGLQYELRHIKQDPPTAEELSAWQAKGKLPLTKFFNTNGTVYKSMGLKDKLPSMSDEEMLHLLASDGMIVKRPLLVGDDFVLTGFKEAEWREKLAKTEQQ